MIDPEVLADFAWRFRREADRRHMTMEQLFELVIEKVKNSPNLRKEISQGTESSESNSVHQLPQ